MKDINAETARDLTRALLAQAIAIGEAHGLNVTTRGARFDGASCVVRVEFYAPRATEQQTAERIKRAEVLWKREHALHELTRSVLGQSFSHGGKRYTVLGLEADDDARLVLTREERGHGLVQFPPSIVAHLFASREAISRLAQKERRRARAVA